MRKNTLCLCLALVSGCCLITGCATKTIVSDPKDKLVTQEPDTQDFAVKAEEMVASMLDSSVLDKVPKPPAVIMVGKIVSNVGFHVDSSLLTKKIRVALNKGKKAITDTTGGVLNAPDFTLSGKIIDTYRRVGNKSQHTYTFQLSLTDNQGLAVWEEEKEVTKLTKRSGAGL